MERSLTFPQPTLIPRSDLAIDAMWVGLAVALISLAAQISIPLPFTPVPITGQTFAVLLSAAALGAVRGTAAASIYVLLPLAGLPLYADHEHGWHVLSGASGGYLVAFPVAALVVGRLAESRWTQSLGSSVGAMLTGTVVIYVIGVSWLAVSLGVGLDKALTYGLYPFVPGDVLKLYLAAALLPAAWRVVHRR